MTARSRARRQGIALVAAALVLAAPLPGRGQRPGPDEGGGGAAELGGDLTVHFDLYDLHGDRSQSVFQFDGPQSYAQVALRFERRASPWHVWRGQLLALANNDDYRSPHRGAVLERLTVFEENGVARLPYRLEVGDTYAFISQRTLQRTLKGAQVEVQSPLGHGGALSSLQLVTGIANPAWRSVRLLEDFTVAGSWLADLPGRGRLGAAYLENIREKGLDFPAERRDQRLATVAGAALLHGEQLVLEGEASRLFEDRSRVADPGSAEHEVRDTGAFLQLSGNTAARVNYRLRFESYGDEYRPADTPILPDRRSGEGDLGWRSAAGLDIRGRFIRVREGWEHPDPLDSWIAGVTFAGPFLHRAFPGVNGVADVFVEDRKRDDGSIDQRTSTGSLEVSRTYARRLTPRLRLFLQDRDDRAGGDLDTQTGEIRLATDVAVRTGAGLRGSIGPSLLFRRIRDHVEASDDWAPGINVTLSRGAHSLRTAVEHLSQDRLEPLVDDIGSLSWQLAYRHAGMRNEFGLEVDARDRDPSDGVSSRAIRTGVYYTQHLARRFAPPPLPAAGSAEAPAAGAPAPARALVTDLRPGLALEDAAAVLERAGVRGGTEVAGLRTYDVTVEPEINLRQQLLVVVSEATIERTAIVFEAFPSMSSAEFLQSLERFRRLALSRWGRPATFYEEGDAGSDVREAVNAGTFFRLMEWTVAGGTLRLGVPKRLDGKLTFELQLAPSFPGQRDPLWSASDIRG